MSNVKSKKKNREMIVEMTLTAVLAALIILMTFTPIGYIPINPVLKLTLITLPVAVGSVVLGPKAGAVLGAVFGLSSFITCFGMDSVGTYLMEISPLLTFIMCFVPRVFCGLLPALIYKGIGENKIISVSIATTSTAVINTVLFLSTMWIFFGNDLTEASGLVIDSIITLFITFAGINALIEAGVCLIAGTAIAKALLQVKKSLHF